VLEHKATPTFTNNDKVGLTFPNFLRHFDEKWIGVCLHDIGIPVPVILISNNDFTSHELLSCICRLSVIVDSL